MVAQILWHGAEMEKIRRDLEKKRRNVDDVILELSAKRNVALQSFQFTEADQIEKALNFLASCQHNLFMSLVALGL